MTLSIAPPPHTHTPQVIVADKLKPHVLTAFMWYCIIRKQTYCMEKTTTTHANQHIDYSLFTKHATSKFSRVKIVNMSLSWSLIGNNSFLDIWSNAVCCLSGNDHDDPRQVFFKSC